MALAEQQTRVGPLTLARDQTVPLSPAFDRLLPAGLPRGSLVEVRSRVGGARSLAMALAAASSQQGQWVVFLGLEGISPAAAAELGVALERMVVVDEPPPGQWATVVAALIGAFELVVLGSPARVRAGELRRLRARARERGTVLVVAGGRSAAVHHEAEHRFMIERSEWSGVGQGHGHLRARRVGVEATGRRGASRPRRADLWLPGPFGEVAPAEPEAEVLSFSRPRR